MKNFVLVGNTYISPELLDLIQRTHFDSNNLYTLSTLGKCPEASDILMPNYFYPQNAYSDTTSSLTKDIKIDITFENLSDQYVSIINCDYYADGNSYAHPLKYINIIDGVITGYLNEVTLNNSIKDREVKSILGQL